MMKKLGLIHTSATLVPVFQELTDKYLASKDIKVFNISDLTSPELAVEYLADIL